MADDHCLSYVQRSGRGLLLLAVGATTVISRSSLDHLPATARLKAQGHGEWTGLQASLAWSAQAKGRHLLAWKVSPEQHAVPPSRHLRNVNVRLAGWSACRAARLAAGEGLEAAFPRRAQWVRVCPRVAPHDDVGGKPSATEVLLVRAH